MRFHTKLIAAIAAAQSQTGFKYLPQQLRFALGPALRQGRAAGASVVQLATAYRISTPRFMACCAQLAAVCLGACASQEMLRSRVRRYRSRPKVTAQKYQYRSKNPSAALAQESSLRSPKSSVYKRRLRLHKRRFSERQARRQRELTPMPRSSLNRSRKGMAPHRSRTWNASRCFHSSWLMTSRVPPAVVS
jgi:hypothetical protein